MQALEAGQKFERYRIVRLLGNGVSGTSYQADDTLLHRRVTLKLIHPWSIPSDAARRQFFREIQGVSELSHPSLAPILDYGEASGQLYLTRRHIGPGSLLNDEGRTWYQAPLPVAHAITYTYQLAQTLHYIHASGYIHGSLTFSNILVSRGPGLEEEPDFEPFLISDVGTAHFVRRFSQPQLPFLPITAAPEQLGKHAIAASDQYALAVVLYFWLTRQPPFVGTPQEIEEAKLSGVIPAASTLNAGLTSEQDAILQRAMSVYPEERYPSVLTFAEALQKTLKHQTSNSSPHSEQNGHSILPTTTEPFSVITPLALDTSEGDVAPLSSTADAVVLVTLAEDQSSSCTEPLSLNLRKITQPLSNEAPPSSEPELTPSTEETAQQEPADTPAEEATQQEPEATTAAEEDNQEPPTDLPARLIITSPYAQEPREVWLQQEEMTIGRAGSSDIVLDEDTLTSRHHALIRCREGQQFAILDQRSLHGVFVNGQKLENEQEYVLVDEDSIAIGEYTLTFQRTRPGLLTTLA